MCGALAVLGISISAAVAAPAPTISRLSNAPRVSNPSAALQTAMINNAQVYDLTPATIVRDYRLFGSIEGARIYGIAQDGSFCFFVWNVEESSGVGGTCGSLTSIEKPLWIAGPLNNDTCQANHGQGAIVGVVADQATMVTIRVGSRSATVKPVNDFFAVTDTSPCLGTKAPPTSVSVATR